MRTYSRVLALLVVAAVSTAGVVIPLVGHPDEAAPVLRLSKPDPTTILVSTDASTSQADTALGTDPNGLVPLLAAPADHDSVLLRISSPATPSDLTIAAGGAPVMVLDSGESGSTTVLVPVVDGAVHLSASHEASVDIDPLAWFQSDSVSPGSTVSLATPETRADTSSGLAGDALGTTPLRVGVTGRGGVPAQGVRAIHVTAVVEISEATSLLLANQLISLPAGRSALTTVVIPEADGTVPVSLAHGVGSLRLDVRGWVPEATTEQSEVNVVGSYVPAGDLAYTEVIASTAPSSEIDLGATADASFVLALVEATSASSTLLTVADTTNATNPNTPSGIAVDATNGAPAQLTVISVDSGRARASVTSGQATTRILPLGSILGAPDRSSQSTEASVAPVITIDSPVAGTNLDLADGGFIQLEGKINATTSSLDSVRVAVDGVDVAVATVRPDGAGWRWTAQTSAPASGSYKLTATVNTRDNQRADAFTTVTITVPEPDTLVLADELVLVSDDGDVTPESIDTVADDYLTFSQDPNLTPGAVLVAGASEAAPRGLLRNIEAIDRTSAGWVVHTTQADITDAVIQADEDIDIGLGTEAVELEYPLESDAVNGAATVIDEGIRPVWLTDDPMPTIDALTLQDADEGTPSPVPTPTGTPSADPSSQPTDTIAPAPATSAPEAAIDGASSSHQAAISTIATVKSQFPGAVGIDQTPRVRIGLDSLLVWQGAQPPTDLSRATDATKKETLDIIREDGGAALAMDAYAELSVRFTLKVGISWRWGLPLPTVTEHRVVVGADVAASISADSYPGVPVSSAVSLPVARIVIPTTIVPIGPVPLVVSGNIDVDLKGSVVVDGAGHLGTSARVTGTYGYEYLRDSGFRTINDDDVIGYGEPDVEVSSGAELVGSIEASGGIDVNVVLFFYELVGPGVKIGVAPGVGVYVSEENGPLTTQLFTDLTGQASIGLRIPILGFTLPRWTPIDLAIRVPVARYTFGDDQELVEEPPENEA